MKNTSVIVAILLNILFFDKSYAGPAEDVLKKLETGLNSKDETALVDMTIIESNGQSKERRLEIKKRNAGKQEVMVRLHKPADVKGIGLLSIVDKSSENQWLYLPSQKKSRRIASTSKKEKFLDSEFSYEDFSASTYKNFKNSLKKEESIEGKPVKVVESVANSGDSPYQKIVTWVDSSTYKPLKTEYYDHEGKLLKIMDFSDYKQFGKGVWRAQVVKVENVQNKRKTILKLSDLKINSGLKEKEFSKQSLESF